MNTLSASVTAVGWLLITIGIIVFFVGAIMIIASSVRGYKRRGRFRGGGLIMLGPIPIIFGSDKESVRLLILLSIILIVVMLVFIIVVKLMLGG
ncbi:MAG: DUF131 domain-containing protein [Candidatus Bathyarchaeia archaeon]